MESPSPSGSPDSELAALRIISHIHTAAWGVVDLRRSIERALPQADKALAASCEALAASCEALLDVLNQADAEAVHAYNHAVLGQCPQGFQATPMRNDDPHGRAFRMDGLEDPRPEQPEPPDEPRDGADMLF